MLRIRWAIDGATQFVQVFDTEAAARMFLELETDCTAEDLRQLFATGKLEDLASELHAETKVTTPWTPRPDFGSYFRLLDGNLRGCPMLANGDRDLAEESEHAIDLQNLSTRELLIAIEPAETATLLDVYRDLMLAGDPL